MLLLCFFNFLWLSHIIYPIAVFNFTAHWPDNTAHFHENSEPFDPSNWFSMGCLRGAQILLQILENSFYSFYFLNQILQRTKSLLRSKNKFQWKQWYANAPEEVLCGLATLQSDGYYGALFWRQVIPNPNSTPSSANTLEALSGTIQLKEEHIPRFCLAPSDGITTWSSGGRLTAYIYARGCLIRLALLFPIGLRRKASAAHCLRNLIRRWCHLNKAKRWKTGSEPYGKRAWESFTSSLCFHGEWARVGGHAATLAARLS